MLSDYLFLCERYAITVIFIIYFFVLSKKTHIIIENTLQNMTIMLH